eukprot:scaffold4690_cov116-Cylindrotheca_fusiformis.AAC.15
MRLPIFDHNRPTPQISLNNIWKATPTIYNGITASGKGRSRVSRFRDSANISFIPEVGNKTR